MPRRAKSNKRKASLFQSSPIDVSSLLQAADGDSTEANTVNTSLFLASHNAGSMPPPSAAVYAQLDEDFYLRPPKPEKKTGRGAKYTGSLDIVGSLYGALEPADRRRICGWAIRNWQVPPSLHDEARSEIEFAWLRTRVDGKVPRNAGQLAKDVAQKFAYVTVRDLGRPIRRSDDVFKGQGSTSPVHSVSLDGEEAVTLISDADTAELAFVDADDVSTGDPDLMSLCEADRRRLEMHLATMGPRLYDFSCLICYGESPSRAADIQGITTQTAGSYMRRIHEKLQGVGE